MEPKAQTYQQKLGFIDSDLKKPLHDEIMIWLDNNIEILLMKFIGNILTESNSRNLRLRIDRKKWEDDVRQCNTYNNTFFLIGYIDFTVEFFVSYEYKTKEESQERTQSEKVYFFEVKTEMKSIGELLRQINTYKAYLHMDTEYNIYNRRLFFVVCPDESQSNVIISQGVGFIKYDKDINRS